MPRAKAAQRSEGPTEGHEASTEASARVTGPRQAAPKDPRRASRLPSPVQLPLAIILSFSVSILAYSLTDVWSGGQIASVARQAESKAEVTPLFTWKLFELSLGWYGGHYDGYDLAALNLLSHGPYHFLLVAFYGVSPGTAAACLAIDLFSGSLPFLLLRPLSAAHSIPSSAPNSEVVADRGIQVSTSVLSGLIYSATLFIACKTYLPSVFVLYFQGITSVEPELSPGSGRLLVGLLMLLFGLAARSFIFTPYAATGRTTADAQIAEFDPVSATLGETLWWNVWGYSTRTKVAILRTAVVMFVTWISTYLQCATTVKGVESYGAAVYASSWAVAAMLTGLALEVVGDV